MYLRLIDARALQANTFQRDDTIADLGEYAVLEIFFRLLKPGTGTGGGKVILQTAAVNETDAFDDISGAQIVVDSTGTSVRVQVTSFLRFVRWRADGNVAGQPVLTVDIVAKRA